MERKLKGVNQALQVIQKDIKHMKSDVDLLKSVLLEDSLLTKEEREHLKKTIASFRKGEMKEFVSLDDID